MRPKSGKSDHNLTSQSEEGDVLAEVVRNWCKNQVTAQYCTVSVRSQWYRTKYGLFYCSTLYSTGTGQVF